MVCSDREALFDALTERRPDCLVYVLDDLMLDLGLLAVLRRVAPRLPFIVLGGASGLEARRSVQDLKPTYYGMFPLDPPSSATRWPAPSVLITPDRSRSPAA